MGTFYIIKKEVLYDSAVLLEIQQRDADWRILAKPPEPSPADRLGKERTDSEKPLCLPLSLTG